VARKALGLKNETGVPPEIRGKVSRLRALSGAVFSITYRLFIQYFIDEIQTRFA
jgi:hypothetical protein